MSFRYDHTCPIIDSGIENIEFKDAIRDLVHYVVEYMEKHPDTSLDEFEDNIVELNDSIANTVSEQFEDVRQSNVDMRSSAESQVDDVIEQRDEAQQDLSEATDKIDSLEDTISDLRRDITDLNSTIESNLDEISILTENNERLEANLQDSI